MTARTEESVTQAIETLSVTQAERDKAKKAGNSLPDGSYPINNVHQLHAAAVLAASHHGDWKAAMTLIRRRARELGVDVTTLPGFGESKAAQRDPAWEQRRKRWAGSLIGQHARRSLRLAPGNIEVRARPDGTGGTKFEFRGYAATFGDLFPMWDKWGDPYDEEVVPDAFTPSLRRADLDTPFLVGHNDAGLALARTWDTLRMGQDSRGLETLATMNGRRSDVQNLAIAVEDKNVSEMSVGFVTRGQQWSDDYSTRYLTEMDIHRGDVSVVTLAANPHTKGVSMVALPAESLSREAAELRANPIDQNLGDSPDYDPWPHAAAGTIKCGGCSAMNHPDAKFCDQCGSSVAGGDALIRVNDDGVPGMTEEHGESAQLALRRRRLELLRMGHRNG